MNEDVHSLIVQKPENQPQDLALGEKVTSTS
jgi:hypothetical protein